MEELLKLREISIMCVYSDEEKSILAESFICQCRAIARKMTITKRYLFDEAESVAYQALDEAIRTHDPARAIFPKHANRVIGERITDYIRMDRPKGKGRGSLPKKSEESVDTIDPYYCDNVGWEMESEDYVTAMSKKLPKRHGRLIVFRYLHADSQKLSGLAKNMGSKKSSVVQLHCAALSILREYMINRVNKQYE